MSTALYNYIRKVSHNGEKGKVNKGCTYMYTDLAIYDFIWPVYGEVTLLLSEEVTDLPTWGDFKHLIIENKVSHINIQWGELNFAAGFLSERDSA